MPTAEQVFDHRFSIQTGRRTSLGILEYITATFAIGVVDVPPRELLDMDDLIEKVRKVNPNLAEIMYLSLHPLWKGGKLWSKMNPNSNSAYGAALLATHKIKKD